MRFTVTVGGYKVRLFSAHLIARVCGYKVGSARSSRKMFCDWLIMTMTKE